MAVSLYASLQEWLGLQWAWAGFSTLFLSSRSNRQEAPCFIYEHLKAKSYLKGLNTVNPRRVVPISKDTAEDVYWTHSIGFHIAMQYATLAVFSDYSPATGMLKICAQVIYFSDLHYGRVVQPLSIQHCYSSSLSSLCKCLHVSTCIGVCVSVVMWGCGWVRSYFYMTNQAVEAADLNVLWKKKLFPSLHCGFHLWTVY